MAIVYLIGEIENDNTYKIGVTRHNDVNKRKKELQTGCGQELFIKDYFQTEYPFKLEKMLHNHFRNSKIHDEWFELTNEEIFSFKEICQKYQTIIESLKDNPYYFNKKEPF